MQPQPANKKLFIIGGVIVGVLLIVAMIVGFMKSANTTVDLIVLPQDSKVTIDGQPSHAGTVSLKPGKHTLKATRQYFTDAKKDVDTENLSDGDKVYLMPSPDSAEAVQYLAEHPDIQEQREEAGSKEADAINQSINDKFPIVNNLPYETTDYVVNYSLNDTNTVISLQVTLKPISTPDDPTDYKDELTTYKQEAIDWMKSQNMDSSKAKITYTPDPSKL